MMPRLLQSSSVVVFFNNYLGLFHSQASKLMESRNTQQHQRVKITNVEDALNVFDEMLQRRPLPSIFPFTQVLGQLAMLKHYSTVISLNNQMVVSGIRPDAYTLTIIINCFCHLNQMEFSLSVLGNFFKLGFDVTTYTTLINGFLLKNREAEAAALFNKMMEKGNCKPDVVTFGTLVKGLCLKGTNTAAIQLLKKMEGACKPDVVVYSTIIDSFCKDTLVVDALNLFSEMTSKGIAPDIITYTSFIHGFCKVENWKEAKRLFNEMVENQIINYTSDDFLEMSHEGVVPNMVTYSTLIDGFCKMGKTQDALNLFSQMQACGQLPNIQTYSILLHGL
ncbi:pentatricopeptide repeat-containing protein At1g62910-like [Malus sylvestris]|uniref:pentatricopeptide repeat-containing protein At1g62910-like n=1 Tax=Malus sylvestris TaxID=3752 RepID=UPI0021AC2D6D|nr:pentatricopeptide repeat-containing protein At1g62910-like [Malus sylvestris]